MKNLLALLLAAALCASALTACGRKKDNSNMTPAPPATEDKKPDDDAEKPGKDTNPMPDMNSDSNVVLKEGTKLEDIILKLGEELGIAMPRKLDDDTLKNVFGINPEDLEEYYGEYSVVDTSADHLFVFKVKDGKKDAVIKALEDRKAAVVKNFEQNLPDQLEKAQNAQIIEKGPYVFFIIAGDSEKGIDKEMERAQEIIDRYF